MNEDPLDQDTSFPYLGHTVVYNNSNWEALYQNLWKACRQWEMVGKVVKKMRATVQVGGMLYKEVIKSVLLYGINSWVVMGDILKVIEVFHHQLSRSITGMMEQRMTSVK